MFFSIYFHLDPLPISYLRWNYFICLLAFYVDGFHFKIKFQVVCRPYWIILINASYNLIWICLHIDTSIILFLDVVTIDKTGEHFRLIYDVKGRFTIHRITPEEAKVTKQLLSHDPP